MKKSLFLSTLRSLMAEAAMQRDLARENGHEHMRDMWSAVHGHLQNAHDRATS